MNKFKSLVLLAALVLPVAAFSTGCSGPSTDRYPTATKDGARLAENKVRFKGTIVYHRDDGGYFTIVSDSGEEYLPLDLPPNYRIKGLRVMVYGETRGYFASEGKGRPLDVFEIGAL